MNKQGYLIGRSKTGGEYFTSSSAYDRPQWVALTEATIFPTADLAQAAAKKLWQYGVYSASPVQVMEALSELEDDLDDELDPSLEGLPPEDIETLGEPTDELNPDDESAYGGDGELDGEGVPAIDGTDDESAYGADGELDGEGVPAIDGTDDESTYGADGELDGAPVKGNFEFELPDDEDEDDENAISDIELKLMKRPTMEAVDENGDRTFQTFAAWKRAVKAINPSAEFYGDKDIGGAKGIGEWDGETGLIFAKALRDKWSNEKTNESIITEISKTTLKSYLRKAVKSTKELVDKGDMVKGVSRAKKAAWASGKLKEKMFETAEVKIKDPVTVCDKSAVQDYANAPGCDKITIPASIKSSLSTAVSKFKSSAAKYDKRDDVQSSQDLTVQDALQQLLDDLSAGTLEGVKQAQIHMTSYMTPITQHIPADVVKFIAKGGKQDSLKDMFSTMKESKRVDFDSMADEFVSK